jgi:hypothetical protein
MLNSRSAFRLCTFNVVRTAVVAGLAVSVPGVAFAQERSSKLEEAKEASPVLEPVGARVGVFRAFIGGDAAAVYDDNIYAQDVGTVSDTYFKISPKLRITSDTTRYKFNVSAGLDRYEYADEDSESRTDWNVQGDVVAELLRDTNVTLYTGYRHATEERGAPDSPTTARSPVRYNSFTAGGGLSREVGRLKVRTIVDYEKLDYRDGRQGNGAVIDNDDRDRQYVAGGGELSYEFSSGYSAFGRLLFDRTAYDVPFDNAGFNRDGKGYRATGGVKLDLSNVVAGNIYAGYMRHNYKDPRLATYSGAVYGASLRWTPSRLTTISIDANRTVQETTQVGFRGYISSNIGVRVEHDLTRFIQLSGGLRIDKNNYLLVRTFVPLPVDRDDDLFFANLGVRYTFSRQVSLGAGWEYAKRSSNSPAADYERNKINVTLRLTF